MQNPKLVTAIGKLAIVGERAGLSIAPAVTMSTKNRYLQFDNIDMEKPDISSRCSGCGREFTAEPKVAERVDDVLLRLRAEFEAHNCRECTTSMYEGRVRPQLFHRNGTKAWATLADFKPVRLKCR